MSFLKYPLLMNPFYSYRPWGGNALAGVLHKQAPTEGGPYGEAWELSDHPDGRSTIANGPYAGRLFGELMQEFPRDLLGVEKAPERYPLLVKYIDAAQDLSVQVHPTNETAPPGDRGKTECWYVMHAEPGAVMVIGLPEGTTPEKMRECVRQGGSAVEQIIRRVPIFTGDFVYIPAGTVHATMAGTLLCEVQQASNTTYRIWDWDRKPERPLHVEQACAVTHFDAVPPPVIKARELPEGEWHVLVENEFFSVATSRWHGGLHAEMTLDNPHGLILNIPEGHGRLMAAGHVEALKTGQTWFLAAGIDEWSFEAGEGGLRLLLSQSREL